MARYAARIHQWLARAVPAVALAATTLSGAALTASAQSRSPRDSAGIRILHLPARSEMRETLHLESVGQRRGGGLAEDLDDEITQRNPHLSGFSLPSGEFVVLDVSRLRIYSARGQLTSTLGRPGAGPGEARLFTRACVATRDTFVAFDEGTRRISVATRESGIVRQVVVAEAGYPRTQHCFGDGTLLFHRAAAGSREMRDLLRIDTSGRVLGTLMTFPTRTSWSTIHFAAHAGRLVVADPLTTDVRVLDPSGNLLTIVRFEEEVGRLSQSELRRVGAVPARASGASRAGSYESRRPLYSQIFYGSDNTLWFRDFEVGSNANAAWTGISVTTGTVHRFAIDGHPVADSRPQARLQEVDSRGVTFLYTNREDGAKSFEYFAFRPAR